jgi:hypothetical protein
MVEYEYGDLMNLLTIMAEFIDHYFTRGMDDNVNIYYTINLPMNLTA